jgi:hypothetical protein
MAHGTITIGWYRLTSFQMPSRSILPRANQHTLISHIEITEVRGHVIMSILKRIHFATYDMKLESTDASLMFWHFQRICGTETVLTLYCFDLVACA